MSTLVEGVGCDLSKTADPVNTKPGICRHETPDSSETLAGYSPRDKPWDRHRANAEAVESVYRTAEEFERYAARISQCSGLLRFAHQADPDTGELRLRLRKAYFCRVRHCPVCQWRRSLMHQAQFLKKLPRIIDDHPLARWVFLTLTVRNCSVLDLSAQLTDMNKAWNRLRLRAEFRPVIGWVRGTEVTRGADGSAHPHFHVLMLVPPSMLSGRNYVTQKRWRELWQETARLDYDPVVNIKAVKPKAGAESGRDSLRDAISETLKYSVKPADMTEDPEWFLELSRQIHRRRFLAAGGVLKSVFRREGSETAEDLIHADDDGQGGEDDSQLLAFGWYSPSKQYLRCPT